MLYKREKKEYVANARLFSKLCNINFQNLWYGEASR